MASAPLAAAGEQKLREKLRRDAHGTEQTYVARQRRAQRMSHLTGTAVERVYRVSPTRNPADYDPEELYLHLRDEHDLRVEAAKAQPYSPPRSEMNHKAPSRRVRLAFSTLRRLEQRPPDLIGRGEAHSTRWRLVVHFGTGRRVRLLLRHLDSQIVFVPQM